MRTALANATRTLASTSDTPRLDAELLMAHALGTTRETLLMARLHEPVPAIFTALLARRLAGEPVAYIVGHQDFWTLTLAVTPAVLIPRGDSETLIEAAIAHFGDERLDEGGPARILDLGTGSGALLLAALDHWPAATGVGVDISPAALEVARRNAAATGLATRADFRAGDWTDGVDERFDLVLCNPPYVETAADLPPGVVDHEPHGALFAGADGLDVYRVLGAALPRVMAQGAVACVEIGSGQAVAAAALFPGFAVEILPDLGARDRCLVLKR